MKHIMCVRFREWPIERRRRREKQQPCKPLVLIERVRSRELVVFANEEARASGIKAGMALVEAHALCGALHHADHDAKADEKSLRALACWMLRFSPLVAIESTDALILDVTGTERLHGGFDALCEHAFASLSAFGLSTRISIAPTVGASWAFASFGREKFRVVKPDELRAAISPLPVAALRVTPEIVDALHTLGLETVGQIIDIPRKSLPVRFGAALLTRIDQALGQVDEPIVPVREKREIKARLEFECPIDSLEMLWEVFRRLVKVLTKELRDRGLGAKELVAEFMPENAPSILKEIHLSEPTANSHTLFNLLRCAGENAKTHTGYVALGLSVPVSEVLTAEQLTLLDREEREAEKEFSHLVERLRVRMGERGVELAELIPSHLPERAFRFAGVGSIRTATTRRADTKRHLKSRPLHLLPEPTEIRCISTHSGEADGIPVSFTCQGSLHRITRTSGPERISGMWWEGRNKTREYFDVEDSIGRRFWLFRVSETRKWYLHGIFDC